MAGEAMTEGIQVVVDDAATMALLKVASLLKKLVEAENMLDRGWAEFGSLLADVKRNKYWQGQYESFNAYLSSLKEDYGLNRVQLYAYAGCANDLIQGGVSADQLNAMGITKAGLLRESIKASGANPPEDIVAEAVKPEVTVQDLRKILFDRRLIGEEPEHEGMTFMDLSFYATAEQRAVIETGITDAARVDPQIQSENLLKDPSAIRESLIRMAQDFSGTWGAEVVGNG
jgi:hypothetical protein